ncbi:nucleotidyltransferase family protein [Nitrosococcus watsonii]|uniref:Nucleotidyl transferase n=1 Tax=Nitrosococcus watsoni (strain C-113) TaxID=105559 RepID=D8KBF2_NITWC|nr:sugar phosphate nucleotidyltransferase [Nitrosococcus watsonii]ADJ29599.1 Nucleotidyl transferase [Nitrosococcus watsonii C-113]
MIAVIQAGGKGTRLRPYTLIMPKPMMPVGDQPVIEVLLKWLRRWGIHRVFITTGYMEHLIRALCGDGSQWDMEISYSAEPEPLGTIGPLRLLGGEIDEPFLVLNGDLITDLDLGEFITFHRRRGGPVTIGTTRKEIAIDLGVLDAVNDRLTGFREKPKEAYRVSMGIYCMEPSVLELIPRGVPFGFDDLAHEMLARDLPIYLYEHEGLWMDIGREDDFCRAQNGFLRDYKSLILGA